MIVVRNPKATVAACERKTRYETEQTARLTGRRIIREGDNAPDRLWPYACPNCKGWHLTKRQGQKRIAITEDHMWEGIA
mgnify:CR=1 FL=1